MHDFDSFKYGSPPKIRWMESGLLMLPFVFLVLLLDQVSKEIVSFLFTYGHRYEVMPSFNIYLVHNPGAAFSLFADWGGYQRWVLAGFSAIVSCALLYFMRCASWTESRLYCVSLALLLAGALGNLVDRALLGYVVDFIDLYWQNWHWPAFNVADASITIGALLLLLDTTLQPKQEKRLTEFK